ncbi:SDR family oxidoreductase [Domibacillus enclensis]|uniref:3-oxoacyl-[acyl-carrier protein] reductase n=1 Tax=Domibacillus enclensis TaxID=1017273 RepID=A0A1N7AB26_9BACI|nr:SDR family oxidoreductase [Domibacillus enclensis]SIR36347.1 3-oxoacyl-[acyl-carrier protein] reductase [Domibacillus enclensis]
MNQLLKGKTIVVTGASKGIGRETVHLLRKYGANVAAGSRGSQMNVSETYLEMPLDVKNESSVRAFCERVIDQFGSIDVLVNCAGTGTFASVTGSSTEDFDEMIAVNLRGSYLMCKYIGGHMEEKGSGHIINMISIAGKAALAGGGGYSASKFGLLGLTKVLQAELRQKGVQVTAILPGAVNSTFWDHIDSKPDLSQMIPVQTVAEHIVHTINQPPGAFIDELTIMPPLGIL